MEKRLKTNLLVAVLLVGLSLVAQNAVAQTRLGLHVTQEELNIWKQRSQSGPYKSAGDVQTNSPGDWTRIQNNANSFLNNPLQHRWSGQPAGTCWSYRSNPPSLPPGRNAGEKLRDAGFVYLLTSNTSYRDAVLNELLAQAATAGTNWADSTRWNVSSNCAYGDAWSWEITAWLTKLLYGYDYIRNSISAANRATLDTWFINAANLWNQNTHTIITTRFPNRDSDDYARWGSGYPVCVAGPILTHFGGFNHCDFHEGWNNRSANHVRFFGLVGIMLDDSTLKDRAKRWFKEWVRFANFADSTNSQMHRTLTDSPGIGWNYTAIMIGGMVTLADAFGRIGDLELYNYSTSLGDPSGTLTPAGGPKSLLSITKRFLDYVDGNVQRYATTNAANNGNPNYKIDSVDEVLGAAWISDSYVIPGNLYWRDSRVTAVYRRTASGAPTYPANPSSFGACVYCGDWATLPGVFFMFGQMEGEVSPYSTGTPATTLNFTANPGVVAPGESSTLTWSSTNATSCSAADGWSGTKGISGSQVVTPSQTTSYTLTCTGNGGSTSQVITLTVLNSSTTTATNLANSSTLIAHSNNFASNQGPNTLWDGDTVTELGSAGNYVDSFWVEFDLGTSYSLTKARLFGDAIPSWLCESWKVETKLNQTGAYGVASTTSPCNANQWFEKALNGTAARFVKVTVLGSPITVATQARELEIIGTPSSPPPVSPTDLTVTLSSQ
jgi:hypothetical protein